jgi:hypothetical protein
MPALASHGGRDPGRAHRDGPLAGQQRSESWLVSKIRTDTVAMMGINLNAQVIIKNLQNLNTHEKSLPPTGARTFLGGKQF